MPHPPRARATILAALLLVTPALPACDDPAASTPDTLTPVAQTAEWPASTPEAEGLDAAVLGELVGRIRSGGHGAVHSLLIARNGRLVVEEYFGGWTAGRAHTQQSVTKSVTSLLAGIAAAQGRLRLDDPVLGFFPAYRPVANPDARKEAMTVADLLTMRTGLDWSEGSYAGSPLQRMNDCGCDWLRFVLDWPMREPPGTRWEYVSGGTIVLGGIVGGATGRRVDAFAETELFAPLGVQGARWVGGLPDGLPHTGGGLFLRPRDMAKLGVLMAGGGRWQGRQVVPEEWVRASTQRVVRRPRTFGAHRVDYGYLWWILDLDDPMSPRPEPGDVVTASGARGQWIFAVPRYGLVVATTAENENAHFADPVDFLYTHVLASVRR